MDMPVLTFDNLSETEKAIAEKIVTKHNTLRTSKPNDGEAQYVWRMVCFMVSPKPAHHCIPMTHDFGVMGLAPKITKYCNYRKKEVEQTDFDWVRNRCKELDMIVDKIVDNVKIANRHGINRWVRAFGKI